MCHQAAWKHGAGLGAARSRAGQDCAGKPISLRELLVHMIEEYARHNGHADLLRERVDGRVGQWAGHDTPQGSLILYC
jgi:Protein of unknown function (DUF664)